MRDARAHVVHERRTYWTSGLVGIAFAAGWSPCIGPILAAILASHRKSATPRPPFPCYATRWASRFRSFSSRSRSSDASGARPRSPWLPKIEFVAGAFLVVVGLVLVNDGFLSVAGWFYQLFRSQRFNELFVALSPSRRSGSTSSPKAWWSRTRTTARTS